MSEQPQQQQRMPKGVLPPGICPPPGTDIMQFCRDLAESGADFAEQFDRNSATFHGGITTAVPMGGSRIPESMQGENTDWRSLPEVNTLAIEEDFGPDYHAAMEAHGQLNKIKKAISVLNKPVEMVMKLNVQYKGASGDDRTALESRLKGAENDRDGALSAATEKLFQMSDNDVSERTRSTVEEVVRQGKFKFEDKETFGEYMQVLQRANQAIFADQKKHLARIKDIKKAAKTTQVTGYNTSPAVEETPATAAAGA
jgi:hypothetical protein